jgi:hypothetical protein
MHGHGDFLPIGQVYQGHSPRLRAKINPDGVFFVVHLISN